MKKIKYFVDQKRRLLQNADCLKKGVYVLHRNLRTYLHLGTRHTPVNFPGGGYGMKPLLRYVIGLVFFSVYIPRDGEKFRADAIYFNTAPGPDYKDAKFFDYSSEEKQVLTLTGNKKRYALYAQNRQRFEHRFPLPRLLFQDADAGIYAEEIVNGFDWRRNEETERRAYTALFGFYRRYYAEQPTQAYLPTKEENDRLPAALQISRPFQTVLQHGDLSADNFRLTRDNELFFFDFDHAALFPLYYDVFFLMFNEALINGNPLGLMLLKNGEFDGFFTDNAEKEQYLQAFLHRFWLVRLGCASQKYQARYWNVYQQLMCKDRALEG